jgi:hypothetical protein
MRSAAQLSLARYLFLTDDSGAAPCRMTACPGCQVEGLKSHSNMMLYSGVHEGGWSCSRFYITDPLLRLRALRAKTNKTVETINKGNPITTAK